MQDGKDNSKTVRGCMLVAIRRMNGCATKLDTVAGPRRILPFDSFD